MTPERALEVCRLFASGEGEYRSELDNRLAAAVTRLLAQLAIATDRADRAEAWRFMIEGKRVRHGSRLASQTKPMDEGWIDEPSDRSL